jgi:alcohol dehydrogenase
MKKSAWSFFNPVRILYGKDTRNKLIGEITNQKCLIISSERGRKMFCDDEVLCLVEKNNELCWIDKVNSNPDIVDIQNIIDQLKGKSFNSIIAFGGGSVMDSAKAINLALCKELHDFSLADIISDPRIHNNVKPAPLYTIPTTAGTGGEVTPFATIWDHDNFKKLSLAGPSVFASTAVIDPVLTYDLPERDTIYTGLDAINQAIESIWNVNATPFTIDLATRALKLGFGSLPNLINGGKLKTNRDAMSECSLLAGLAISQTRTALCHSISYPLTAHFNVPHGLACAFTMPVILRLNLLVDDGRFRSLAKCLIGEDATTKDLVDLFNKLHKKSEVCLKVREKVKSMKNLINLIPEMITPERADNSLLNTNEGTIRSIIEESWNIIR